MIPSCIKPQPCPPDMDTHEPESSAPFSVCLGHQTLHWDGKLAFISENRPAPQDGTYGSVTVVDGCIVGFGECEVPTYTPPFCNPNPTPCQEGGTGAEVSPETGNIITQTPLGIYGKVYVSGANISGSGTVSDPIRVTTQGSGSTSIISDHSISVQEITGGFEISLPKQQGLPTEYRGLKLSPTGIITGIDTDTTEAGVVGIVTDDTISKTEQGGIITLSLPTTTASNKSYQIGGYTLTIGRGGVVSSIAESSTQKVTPGTYSLAAYQASLAADGSITGIAAIDNGRGPIMDMYEINITPEVTYPTIHRWGQPLDIVSYTSGINATINIACPNYIKDAVQVECYIDSGDGALSASLDVGAKTLAINVNNLANSQNTAIRLVFRS